MYTSVGTQISPLLMPRRIGMIFLPRGEDPARALDLVAAVVIDPGFAQHLPAEAAVPLLAVPTVSAIGRAGLQVEGVRRGAQPDDRPSGLHVVHDVLHLASGRSRNRVSMITRSAVSTVSRPGMLSCRVGLMVPSGSSANSTVQSKP